jgi:subtilisin-like proprotein convertase family protein
MRFLGRYLAAGVVVALLYGAAAAGKESKDLVVIPQSAQPILIQQQVKVTFKASAFFLAEWDEAQQLAALASGIPFEIIRRDVREADTFFLFELHQGEEPPATWLPLYRNGLNVIVAMNDDEALRWTQQGQHAVRLFHTPHGWGNAMEKFAYDCSPKPLITEMLGKSSQAQWVDWIEKISGVESIDVGGASTTVATRHTASLFSGGSKAFDFLKQQAQAWNYAGSRFEEDPFTVGTSGKNLVLTIPGQTSSEVLLTAHFDSIWQGGDSATSAPGANDNGTGSATLLEAARILRQYRFQRTIKIIWFTGEEQGLYGSAAYTQDHPMGNIAGVLNLDMFGYDANGDRCFEIHNGTLAASIDIGNCFAASIASYGTGLTRDFLTTTATNRSDHASFWNVGVGAIEIAENYFNDNQVGGCVGSEPNPFYHTTNDRLSNPTNMHPPFAYSIAQTALATIAAMAIPVESCFGTTTPSISATGGTNQVDLSWAAVPGASTYRIYRAANGCGGNFISVGTTAATSFADPVVAPGPYAYRVEAVAADGLCVSAESSCVSATPTVYHATPSTATYVDTCATGGPGSGNGVIEPGETVTMQVMLKNDSDTTLTSIAGGLTSPTAGVTLSDPAAAWPNLGPFASAATVPDHFHFDVSPAAACGTTLDLQVQASASEGTWSGSYQKAVGAPGSSSGSFPSADVPKAILDQQTAISNNVVAASGTVVDVNVRVSLTHTWDSDVDMFLRHPDGTLVELSTDNGSNGDNYTNTLFDDEAAVGVAGGTAPFTGSYRPEGLLAALDGKPAAGTWKLEIFDDENQDTGSLTSWSLEMTTSAAPICNPCAAPPSQPGEASLLTLDKSGTDLVLHWDIPACGSTGFGVFRGGLAALRSTGVYGHDTALACGLASASFPIPSDDPQLGDADYFLVAASTATEEGSYGKSSASVERPVSAQACAPAQNLGACP